MYCQGCLNKTTTTTNSKIRIKFCFVFVKNKLNKNHQWLDNKTQILCNSVSNPKLRLHVKLRIYGINGDLLNLIGDFLTGRAQARTRVSRSLSTRCGLYSGVVQGSYLWTLLFLLFINDLPAIFDTAVTPKLYADDLKLYLQSIESDCDNTRLRWRTLTDWPAGPKHGSWTIHQ